MEGPSVGLDGYLDILGGEPDGREGDDGRPRLAGDEESGMNAGGTIIGRQ